MLLTSFELLAYWQIVKDRKCPIGLNVRGCGVEVSRQGFCSLLPDAYVDGVSMGGRDVIALA